MCAAPGMKTTHLAAKLQNDGKIYAVEIDDKRFKTLCSQIEITNSFCVKPLNKDGLTLDSKQFSDVEYILVDPSCSGSGIIDRPKQNNGKSEPERLQNLQSIQVYLLRHALFNFPNVKKIVYSTCSLYPEENEEVIDEILGDVKNAYHLVPVRHLLKDDWINFSSQKYKCSDKCLYSRPDIDFCNGFFVAVFERNFEVPLPECKRKGGNVKSSEDVKSVESFDVKSFENVNLDMMEPNNTSEKISRKRKKRGKKKKQNISTNDRNKEILGNTIEPAAPKSENGKNNTYIESKSEDINNEEKILKKSEDISKTSEDTESKKKSRKRKRSNPEDRSRKEDKKIIGMHNVEEIQQDEEIKILKKKKKKKIKEIEIDANQEEIKEEKTTY